MKKPVLIALAVATVSLLVPAMLLLNLYYVAPTSLQREIFGYRVTDFGDWPYYEALGNLDSTDQVEWRYDLNEEICTNLARDYGCTMARSGFSEFQCIETAPPDWCFLRRRRDGDDTLVALITADELVIARIYNSDWN